MYDISQIRKDYVLSLIESNDYVHLDWIRKCGKTKSSLYASVMYALNNPMSNVLLASIDQKTTYSLLEINKYLYINTNSVYKYSLKRIILNNKSTIYFDINSMDYIKFDLIILDETYYFKQNHKIFDYLKYNKVKILSNSTNSIIKNNDYDNILNGYNFLIDKYKTDQELIHFIRLKKIQKIKNNITILY